ncbi:SOS response-associated peptidase [Pseudomonas sp. FME51]|uniref:SOS response-associated peptidase n=1 Tax=Pseudomonas sp. FME51 TaxID=2742609 RepID=UPI0018665926|nr:SOS response-associated peptidase [Pseudomonas sp. FME51]
MSGRLAQFSAPLAEMPEDWKPNWNVCPGNRLLILRKVNSQLECSQVLWNLTPSWLRDLSRAAFSAQAEFLHDKPMFREPLVQRRCLIPVDGFYVWQQQGRRKQPWYLRQQNGGLALAGLWDRYALDDGTYWDSCALITAPAKGLPARLGGRMPVTLNKAEQAIWLADATAPSALQPLLLNADSQVQLMYPVNPAVSSPATQGPHCCNPTGHAVRLD